jgi:hypothetical protein
VAWGTPTPVLLSWTGLGLLFVILALAPWRWEVAGGLLLVIAGLTSGVAYTIWAPPGLPLISRVTTTIVFSLPPLAAGILFLGHRRNRK